VVGETYWTYLEIVTVTGENVQRVESDILKFDLFIDNDGDWRERISGGEIYWTYLEIMTVTRENVYRVGRHTGRI
jgi:hypothetical protein